MHFYVHEGGLIVAKNLRLTFGVLNLRGWSGVGVLMQTNYGKMSAQSSTAVVQHCTSFRRTLLHDIDYKDEHLLSKICHLLFSIIFSNITMVEIVGYTILC